MALIKKVDKVVLKSFIGPFFITMLVVVFILLTQHMLKYFDDLVGKDLGWAVLGQLMFYFAVFVTPFAFPLGVLLSSLMTFGSLGEHSELTAIKSGGISLPRTMRSIFLFVLLITGVAFLSNNYFVPKAALEAYSLMWDIKRKKPSLDLPEGEFYGGLENYRIRVLEKMDDGVSLKGVIIYDHSDRAGNNEVTVADSGRMTTIMNDRYLRLELFSGHSYMEGTANRQNVSRDRRDLNTSFSTVKFDKSEIVFDLTSFDLERTDKDLFSRNRLMRNLTEITTDIDSLDLRTMSRKIDFFNSKTILFTHELSGDEIQLPADLAAYKLIKDSITYARAKEKVAETGHEFNEVDSLVEIAQNENQVTGRVKSPDDLKPQVASPLYSVSDSSGDVKLMPVRKDTSDVVTPAELRAEILRIDTLMDINVTDQALAKSRQVKSRIFNDAEYLHRTIMERRIFEIQRHKIVANAIACIIMFMIGAPLGSIIKKGGLGMPVLVSIFFFIIYYVFMILGEKWTKSGLIYAWAGIWSPNMILFPIGLFFLYQARRDARLFESDFYSVVFSKVGKWVRKVRSGQGEK